MENNKVEERGLVPVEGRSLFYQDKEVWTRVKFKADMYSESEFVPARYRGKPASCLMAMELAHRTNGAVSELAVMQHMYDIKGNPGIDAQLAITFFEASGEFGKIKYTLDKSEPGNWKCTASAKEKSTGEVHTGPEVSLAMAKAEGWSSKQGSKWQTLPELMLRYRSAVFMIRTVHPACLLGLYTREEVHDMIEAEPGVYELPEEKTVTGALLKDVETPEPVEVTPEVEEEPTTEPPPVEEFTCQVEGCGFKAKSARGLQKHNTQQHVQKLPPEPEEPAAVEPEPETTEPEGEEPGEGEDFFTGAAARLEQLRLGCIDADKEAKFYELLATYDCSNIKDVIDLRNQQFTMEMVNAIENILAE